MGNQNDELKLQTNIRTTVFNPEPQEQLDTSQISQESLHIQRTDTKHVEKKQLSSLKLFRDAVLIDEEEAPEEVKLPDVPQFNDYMDAHVSTGFQFAPSSKERLKLLNDGRRKRFLTNTLLRQEEDQDKRKLLIMKPPEDAFKLSDEKLVVRLGEFDEKNDYIGARLNLIKNKYYALVPEKELYKLPAGKILERLRKLYAEKPERRNYDLIDYYQNLLIMKNSEKELKENKERGSLIRDEEAENTPEITAEKEAGLDSVIAWMRRNCRKSSVPKSYFVDRVQSASRAKQLLMFYLIENGLQSVPTEEYSYRALTDYVPDLNKIKDKVVASKWKFWKRIGSDSSDRVIDWSKLGQAAHFALDTDIPDTILQCETQAGQAQTDFDNLEFNGEIFDNDRQNSLIELLERKGELILTLYRSAGLLPDMPAEIIEDKRLKDRLVRLIREFNETQERLQKIDVNDVLGLKGSLQAKVGTIRMGQLKGEKEMSGTMSKIGKHSKTLSAVVEQVSNSDKMLSYGLEEMGLSDGAVAITSGVTGVLGVLQLLANFKAAAKIAGSASKMTTADHAASSISVTGNILKNVSGITSGTNKIVQYFQGASLHSAHSSWIGETAVKSVGESFSTVSGGIQFCSGCISIIAGTLNIVSGGIEFGRSVSSRRDIKRAKAELNKTPQNKMGRDQKLLKLYLNHEERVASNNNVSAGVKAATGVLTLTGGTLMATGVLAPVGGLISLIGSGIGLGYSLYYARKRRHQARKDTVDEFLKLDERLAVVKEEDAKKRRPKYAGISDDELRTALRQELLSEMGYATYKECFIDICRNMAVMLYQKVFEEQKGTKDQIMYEDALKALGLRIKYPMHVGQKPVPCVEAIYGKLMG